ncbi:MAG TPA: HAMP domain-containing sensor histidine kinase [Abditibacteriaceae bacterium]|jgi:signal transduction histidine kinase|nr:HAMP domain-containing sensor histidine kinase [Abditibacteriaceae bacterium]
MTNTKLVESTREQLEKLASHLAEQRDSLLQRWRTATENISELAVSSSLTRLQFNDHIPLVLDALAERLRTWPEEMSEAAEAEERKHVSEHGLQRWQQGYQLRDLTLEWGHLQKCLMEELEDYARAHPELEPDVMPTARRALSDLCWNGISDSTTQYWRLHQVEASGHVRDLEQALATLNELEQERAEAWRQAAHDLRGSVTVVKGAASMLETEMPEQVRQKFFTFLQRGVSSLHEMLNDLISLARLEAGHERRNVAPFDAAVLLTDFCTTSQSLADEHGLFLRMEGPSSLLVEGDRAKVQRIVQNLMLNAFKYTEHGGVIVKWGTGEDLNSQDWSFCVQDTGPGLDAGSGAPLARQLYQATQSTHKVNNAGLHGTVAGHIANAPTMPAQSETLPASQLPGEGVGLSIVKRLCELLDASLELETSPGEGSTFRVILPRRYDNEAK